MLHQGVSNKPEKLARSFNFSFRYKFGDFYPIELEIKDTTYIVRYASYLDLHLKIDNEDWLRNKRYDKIDDFNFSIVNFPLICSKFQQHLYMEYISFN